MGNSPNPPVPAAKSAFRAAPTGLLNDQIYISRVLRVASHNRSSRSNRPVDRPDRSANHFIVPGPMSADSAGFSRTERNWMSSASQSEQLRIGFMSTLEVEGRGHVGGLLVTSHTGRPLEFQCTTPVKPDRTQEILYGQSLRPWLLGELIGGTLLSRVSIKPDLVVVSEEEMLELRNHTKTPVACLNNSSSNSETTPPQEIGGRQLRFHHEHAADSAFVESRAHLVPEQADLEEPLGRVQEALSETVKTVLAR